MFSRFLKQKPSVAAPTNPKVPDGVVVWAIGDVHGRLDLLRPLVDALIADLERSPASRRVVIFLGDYIDRGPDSRGVIELLANLPADLDIEWRFLKGNHEETMLDFLKDPAVGAKWCEYGGDATLVSYGLRAPDLRHRAEGWVHLAADLSHKLTERERAFLEGQELSVTIGDYFFAHAGARPGQALESQSAEDLMWIRRSFLDSPAEFDRVVVHGHTPAAEVHADRRRIGIDTRAYESGILTALRLFGENRSVMQAVASREDGGEPSVSIRRATLVGPADFVAIP